MEAVQHCLQIISKLSTIYAAEKSYNSVCKHGVDIYRLSSNQGMVSFSFSCLQDWEKGYSPFIIPVSKFLRVAENNSLCEKCSPSASILVPFLKFDNLGISTFLSMCLRLPFWRPHIQLAGEGGSCPLPPGQHATASEKLNNLKLIGACL